jgi:hypothetical protein
MPILEAPRPRRQSLYIKKSNIYLVGSGFVDKPTTIRLEIQKKWSNARKRARTRGAGVRCTDLDFIALEGFYTC